MLIDWNHIYLLGWHSKDGKINLTNWRGNNQWIDVVVVNATDNDLLHLMWDRPLHKEFELLPVPVGTNPQWYAKQKSGLRAFGWYMKDGVKRPASKPLVDPWEWYYKIKGIS